jgi:hypothetical protein
VGQGARVAIDGKPKPKPETGTGAGAGTGGVEVGSERAPHRHPILVAPLLPSSPHDLRDLDALLSACDWWVYPCVGACAACTGVCVCRMQGMSFFRGWGGGVRGEGAC